MSRKTRLSAAFFTVISISIIITWRNYVIVIGQSGKPVLVALNKAEATLAVIDPVVMKLITKVPTGDSPHEVVLAPDGLTAYVANYGAQQPGSSLSVIDVSAGKELRRVDLTPLMRPHGLHFIGGKLYFTSETNRLIARYDPVSAKVDWMMGTGQNGSHMVVGTGDSKKFYTANIGSDSITAFEFQNVPPSPSRVVHIPVGKQPEAIDISPDGKEIWTGINSEGAIDIVDTAANKFKEKLNVGGRPYRVKFTPDGRFVVCSMVQTKELLIIDTATRKELRRIKLEATPLGVSFSADGKTAFISAVEPDGILEVSLESGQVTGRVEPGKAPDGIAVWGM